MDESDEENWVGLVDACHVQALYSGKQAVSQFGHGNYTLQLHVWPNTLLGGITADTSQTSLGQAMIEYVPPTKARYAALHHLKTLEKQNAMVHQNVDNFGGEHHPLLAADVDTSNALAVGNDENALNSGNKGAKVIRFALDSTVSVYGQDSFVIDLNSDGDVTDNHEWKEYTLMTDDADHFGILPRYEASINPTIDGAGNTMVNREWDMPLSKYKAFGTNRQVNTFAWSLASNSTTGTDNMNAYVGKATFTGIEALGGLIKVTIPSFLQRGDAGQNNDFAVHATLTCHNWTPMKR